ncbi:MAG: very short patch repair endonuclease [Cellvibrio sp. 79]|nr:MAG: very short patch repair endonuclease [Cellvibrio sp. 79]
MDIVDKPTRSAMMAGIKNKDTKGELLIRRSLHSLGFRYQLHRKDLPGKPDLVFPKFRAVIFFNGCFWHAHSCHLFKWPSSRSDFWRDKITSNKIRDEKNYAKSTELGWKILVIWECSLKGKTKRSFNEVINTVQNWLLYDSQNAEIEGRNN